MFKRLALMSAILAASCLIPVLSKARELPRAEPKPEPLPPGIVPGRVILYTPDTEGLDGWISSVSGPVVGLLQRVTGDEKGEIDCVIFPGQSQVIDGNRNVWDNVNLTSRPYHPDGLPGTWRFTR